MIRFYRICDRRNRVQHVSLVIVSLIILICITAAMAGQAPQSTGEESLMEHGKVVIDSLVWYAIIVSGGLVGLVLWNVKDMKNTMRSNHEELRKELKKKMSIQLHNAICEHQVEEEA